MKKLLNVLVMVMGVLSCLVGPLALTSMAMAATNVCDDDTISDELKAAAGCAEQGGFDRDTTVMPAAVRVVEIVISATGIVAAGILVYGGLTYVLSTGSPDKTRRAQHIIIYALVGVVVAAFAFTIVYFVSNSIWGEAA